MAFRDISWLSARTNMWDAIGVASYGLVFAFVESLLFFIIAFFASLLLSPKWDEKKRVALLGTLLLILGLWAVLSQLYFILNWSLPFENSLVNMLAKSEHPIRILYFIFLVIVGPSVIVPVYAILQSEKIRSAATELLDRLSLLTTVYLVFDVLALVVVIVRNI